MAKNKKKSLKEQKNDIILAAAVAVLAAGTAWLSAKVEQIQRDTAIKKAAASVNPDYISEEELNELMEENNQQ